MTSCKDTDIWISFMSPVWKSYRQSKKVCFPKLYENTFEDEISALSLWIQKMKIEVFNLIWGGSMSLTDMDS